MSSLFVLKLTLVISLLKWKCNVWDTTWKSNCSYTGNLRDFVLKALNNTARTNQLQLRTNQHDNGKLYRNNMQRHGFVTFVLPFKFFFPFPYLAYRSQFLSDPHAFCFKRRVLFSTRALSGFRTFKLTFKGSPAQKTPTLWPVLGWTRPICGGNSLQY